MLRSVLLFCVCLFLVGCASIQSSYIPTLSEEEYMQATRKTELIVDDTTKIVVVATRMNIMQKYKSKDEVFLLDVYESGDGKKDFIQNGYKIYLQNKTKPLKIQKINKDSLDEFMQSKVMRWSEQYLVTFAPQDKKTTDSLTLVLEHEKYGKNFLQFGYRNIKKEARE